MATKNLELFYMNRPLASIAALKALDTTNIATGLTVTVESSKLYVFNKASTATADDLNIVEPTTGGGRWYSITDLKNGVFSSQTGVIDGLVTTPHPTNDQAVKITGGTIQFVDSYSDPSNPVITTIEYAGDPELVITNIATQAYTYLAINKSAPTVVVQQFDAFTDEEKRDYVIFAQVGHADNTIVRGIATLNRQAAWQTGQSISDALARLGIINLDGNTYSGVAGTLRIQRDAGLMFGQGIGTAKNPNVKETVAENPLSVFTYFYVNSSLENVFISKIAPTNFVDPDNYVLDGVLTPVPTGLFSVQRVNFATGGANITSITYGRAVYDSIRTALNSIDGEVFVESTAAGSVVKCCYMIIKQGCTDTTDDAQCYFTSQSNPMIPSFVDTVNRGIILFPVITQEGGLDITWTNGEIYDSTTQDVVLTTAQDTPVTLTDNAVNYLYWTSGTALTLSTVAPVEPNIAISRFNVQDGTIWFESDGDLLRTREANLLDGVSNVFRHVVVNGLEVSEDTDVTNVFDVRMSPGYYYDDLHKRVTLAEILSRTNSLVRHWPTASGWDSDTNAEIDNDNYADGSGIVSLLPGRYAKGLFMCCSSKLHWIYPREQFTTQADAELSSLPEIPPGLQGLPLLTAYIQREGDLAFAAADSVRWIDVRNTGTGISNGTGIVEATQDNAVWFSSVGLSTNDGRSLSNAKSTPQEAVTAAEALSPTANDAVTVNCEDAYTYTENITMSVPYVNMNAPMATINGNIVGGTNNKIKIQRIASTSGITLSSSATGGTNYEFNDVVCGNGAGDACIQPAAGTSQIRAVVTTINGGSQYAIYAPAGTKVYATAYKQIIGKIHAEVGAQIFISAPTTAGIIDENGGGDVYYYTPNGFMTSDQWSHVLTMDQDVSRSSDIETALGKDGVVAVRNIDHIIRSKLNSKGSGFHLDKFGLGTETPNSALDVQGGQTIKVRNNGSAATGYLEDDDYIVSTSRTSTGTFDFIIPDLQAVTGRIFGLYDASNKAGINAISVSNEAGSVLHNIHDSGSTTFFFYNGSAWVRFPILNPGLNPAPRSITANRDLTGEDIGKTIYSNTNAALTVTVTDALNASSPVGATIDLCRWFGTVTATLQVLTTGSQIVKSRTNTANRYIANPGATFNYLGQGRVTKIANNNWFLSGDISDTAN